MFFMLLDFFSAGDLSLNFWCKAHLVAMDIIFASLDLAESCFSEDYCIHFYEQIEL